MYTPYLKTAHQSVISFQYVTQLHVEPFHGYQIAGNKSRPRNKSRPIELQKTVFNRFASEKSKN